MAEPAFWPMCRIPRGLLSTSFGSRREDRFPSRRKLRRTVVKLEIYGLQGERVASLLAGDRLEAGYHSAVWDGRKGSGGLAASGVYVARLEVEGAALTTRLVLVR